MGLFLFVAQDAADLRSHIAPRLPAGVFRGSECAESRSCRAASIPPMPDTAARLEAQKRTCVFGIMRTFLPPNRLLSRDR